MITRASVMILENLLRLIHIGKKIAQRRSKVLSKVIRGDPKRAFELALPREELADLPRQVSQEMENWEVDTITVEVHSMSVLT